MKRSGFLALTLAGIFCSAAANVSAQVINELDINPAGTDQPCEYIELRGTPGAIIENVHFVAIEGDAAPSGTADLVITFGSPGIAFGSNGLIVVTGTQACGSRTYPPETNRVQTTLLDASNGLENGSISFLLISSTTAITAGTDYDTNNDGTLEALPGGAIILDSVAWLEGDNPIDLTYGNVRLTAFGGVIGAATRSPNNTTPNSSAAWYAGAMTGTNDATTYSATIRTPNFPANGALTPGAPNVGIPTTDAVVDMDGDSRTDYVITRPAGGAGSQLTWFTNLNSTGPTATRDWGVSGDQVIAGDYDGDGKDDQAVFRPSTGTFYIIQSATLTARIEQFGQSGDNARVVGDYDGDGRDDLAVYRPGAQSQWFYKTSPTALFVTVDWGQTGDFPAPGDYDGDGKADFVVQRPTGAAGVFWKRLSGGTFVNEQFGLAGDGVVPGDYDGDGKTDVAVFRTAGGFYTWDYEPSATAGTTAVSDTWGVPGDLTVQGDYDGDGKTDYAVWRSGSPGTFFIMTPGDRRIFTRFWGQAGDVPVARYNTF